MDAISQAVEAYWSVESTESSRSYSQEALEKLLPNIEAAVLHPNPDVRLAMLEGANLAGQAINIAKTTAPHAMSYTITMHYGLSHGQAVALTLPEFIKYNAGVTDKNCQDPRGVKFVQTRIDELLRLLGSPSPALAKKKIEQLMDSIGLKRRLNVAENGIRVDSLVKEIDQSRLSNNPRIVSEDDARSILQRAFD